MRLGRTDPGDCFVCGAAHCGCGGGDAIEVVQLPARDAAAAAVEVRPGVFVSTESSSIFAPLGDGSDGRSFSTATYRGKQAAKP